MMTYQEVADVLRRLSTHYPSFLATQDVINEWYRDLAGLEAERVNSAVSQFIQKNAKGYLPSIARIREYIPRQTRKVEGVRYWKLDVNENNVPVVRPIRYYVKSTKSGREQWVEDEDENIYSCPDPDDQRTLIERVRTTGSIALKSESWDEYEELKKKVES